MSKKGYYEVLAGLSAFESSHKVSLLPEELKELTTTTDSVKEDADVKKPRIHVHAYLGGKLDLNEASNATYDLSHTLLGGYVPRKQLESLSSIDFAHYFHKSLECGNALEVYDKWVGNEYRSMQTSLHKDSSSVITVRNKDEVKDKVRKVVICKKCQSRFVGADRMKELKQHQCV